MARTRKTSKEALEEKIEKAEADVIAAKKTYDQATANLKELLDKRDAIRKEEMKKPDKKPNYMTVPAAIKELEKIEMVRQLDNIYRLDHAVTANQKVILKAFGLDANSIKYFASELSKELKKAE